MARWRRSQRKPIEEYIVSEVLPYEGPTDEIEGTLASEIIHADDFLDLLEDE